MTAHRGQRPRCADPVDGDLSVIGKPRRSQVRGHLVRRLCRLVECDQATEEAPA